MRAGVIGVGYLGRHHARIYSGIEGVTLTALVDTDQAAAKAVAEQYGGEVYSDYRDILDHVDIISIVSPTTTHHDIAMTCLRAGKDLLIEKPITTTVAEAQGLIDQAAARGLIVQVGHLERYNPGLIEAARWVKEPRFIESERLSPFQGRGIDVHVTLDLMIHDIDIAMSLVGDARIKDVRVAGAKVLTDKIDVAKAWIEFEGGAAALITASRVSAAKQRTLKVYQREGFIMLDYQAMQVRRHWKKAGQMCAETMDVQPREPLKEEIEDFVENVKLRRRPRVSGVEGRNALEVALLISKKIEELEQGYDTHSDA